MSLRSRPGPAICRMPTPSSLRTICASDVLPRPGGPASSTWSSASPRAFAASSAISSCSFTRVLADEVVELARAQRPLDLFLGLREHRRQELAAHAAARSASRTCSSTGSASSTVARARSASSSDQPRLTSASRASVCVVRVRCEGVGDAQLLLQVEHDPLGGLEPDPWDRLEPLHVVARDRTAQLGRCRAGDDRQCNLRPDARDAEQQLEQLALLGRREPVELERVLAHDRVDLDRDLAAHRAAGPTAQRGRGSRRR